MEAKIEEYLQQFEDVVEKEQTEEQVKMGNDKKMRLFYRGEKLFLVIFEDTNPLRIEIRCNRVLGKTLRERYESVMAGRALGRNGTEIICSGQLADDEVIDLVRHSYEISVEE